MSTLFEKKFPNDLSVLFQLFFFVIDLCLLTDVCVVFRSEGVCGHVGKDAERG